MSELVTPTTDGSSSMIEHALDEARDSVLRREPDAPARVADVQKRIARLAVRGGLIAALASAEADAEAAGDELDRAITAARSVEDSDVETLLDLALALLVADRPSEAVDVVLQGLRAGAAYAVTPAQLMAFIDQLLGDRRTDEVEDLLRSIYTRLIERPEQVPIGPDPRGPRPGPGRRRRFLKEALRLVDERIRDRGPDPTLLIVRAGTLTGLGKVEEAIDTISKVLADSPDDPLARDLLVAALTRERNYGKAVDELQALPPERLNEPQAVSTHVDLLVRLGTPDEAVSIAEQAGEATDSLEVRTAHVRALSAAGNHRRAQTLARELVGEFPGRADLLLLLADVLHAEGTEDDEEFTVVQQAVASDQSNPITHAALARTLEDRGELDRAVLELERALALDPSRSDLMVRRARLLMMLGRAVEALEVIEAVDVAVHSEAKALRADILFALERYDEALTWYRPAFESAPDADAAAEIAGKLEQVSDELFLKLSYQPALEGLEFLRDHGVELSPPRMTLRAELLRLQRRPRAAVEQAKDAVAAGFEEPWLFGTYGQALLDLSRSDEALELIEPVIGRTADYAFGQSVYLDALYDLDRLSEAMEVLEHAFPHDAPPAGWEVWATMARGQLLIYGGRHNEAKRLMRSALRDSPLEGDWLATLGLAQARLWESRAAAESFRQTLDANGPETNNWVLLEYADALIADTGDHGGEAGAQYDRVLERVFATAAPEPPTPRAKLEAAWASLRLARPREAVTLAREGLAEGAVPGLGARVRLSASLALAGDEADADATLAGVIEATHSLSDATRVVGIIDDAQYMFRLLEHDPEWAHARERLAAMRTRFSAKE
jgi:tetratricopeptide (TPR) repeat protein